MDQRAVAVSVEGLETAAPRNRYVPGWPALAPWQLLAAGRDAPAVFPFTAAHQAWFYRASNAIYHLFRALELQPGDVVLAPDYHSGNEIWAMRAAGARLVFYPVRRNREPDMDELERLCRVHRPRVIYVIHYMGWPQPMDEILALGCGRDTVVVEDCALSMFGEYKGRPLGSLGDYAVYCLYKTLPVPNGGLLVQNRQPALPGLTGIPFSECSLTSVAGRTSELLLEWTRAHANWAGRALDRCKRRCGQALTRLGVERVQVGNIGFDPSKVNIGVSPLSRRLAQAADGKAVRRVRRDNYRYLGRHLPTRVPQLAKTLGDDACPLFFPVLARNKRAVADALRLRGVSPIEFWNYGDPEAQRLGSPDAQFLRDRVLGLPVHQHLDRSQLDYVAAQMTDLQALC